MHFARFAFPLLACVGALAAASTGACGSSVDDLFDADGSGGAGGATSRTGAGPTTSGKGATTTGGQTTAGPTTGTGQTTGQTSSSGPTSSGGPVTSVTTGPATCDALGQCDRCVECAVGPMGPCESQYDACFNDQECDDYVDCIDGCQTQSCYQACYNQHPGGAQLYFTAVECVICDTCFVSCDGAGSGC